MKYIKTLNIWAEGVQEAITSGAIKLQRGQWLRCGVNNRPCRFVEVTRGGTLHVVHWQGTSSRTAHCFKVSVESKKTKG
jgi:hypothetical protein